MSQVVPYPAELPLEAIKEVVRIVQGGTVAQEKAAFGKNVWIVQGYAQSRVLGDPDQLTLMASPQVGEDALVGILNQIVAHAESAPTPQAIDPALLTVPLELLLQWAVKQLLKLLEQELLKPA